MKVVSFDQLSKNIMPIILFLYYAHGSANYYSNLLSQYARAHEESAL